MENGERFNKRTEIISLNKDVVCETECQCDGPGQCPVYDIYMNETRYKRCKYDCEWRSHYSNFYKKVKVNELMDEMREASIEEQKALIQKQEAKMKMRAHNLEVERLQAIQQKRIDIVQPREVSNTHAEIDEVMNEVEKEGVTLDNYTENKEGLGDLIGNVMSKLGVTEEKIQKWSNIGGCGCSARRQFLNKIMPFRKKE